MKQEEESCKSKQPDFSGQSDDIRKHRRSQEALTRSAFSPTSPTGQRHKGIQPLRRRRMFGWFLKDKEAGDMMNRMAAK
jgi:hypothetical protein